MRPRYSARRLLVLRITPSAVYDMPLGALSKIACCSSSRARISACCVAMAAAPDAALLHPDGQAQQRAATGLKHHQVNVRIPDFAVARCWARQVK